MKGRLVENASWPEIEASLAAGAFAVLPIGAASKEHGRHLPMNTDMLQAQWVAERIVERFMALAWPVVSYGYYPAFREFPGSISLSEPVFRDTVGAILDGIEAAGARRIAVVNTGISTIAPLQVVLDSRARHIQCELINVYAGDAFAAVAAAVSEQKWGGHADEIETSIMLALNPSRVDLGVARASPNHIISGPLRRYDETSPNYSPDGVNGDPRAASAVKGERLLAAILTDVCVAIEKHDEHESI